MKYEDEVLQVVGAGGASHLVAVVWSSDGAGMYLELGIAIECMSASILP